MVTVVLVEDDPDLRYLTTLMLELEGLRVRAFESGEEALDSCRRDRPDLVLLDWMMPGMSGLDILRALKIRPATVTIPVVMLSALSEPYNIAAARSAGASDYLVKPFSRATLLKAVRRQLERNGAPGTMVAQPIGA